MIAFPNAKINLGLNVLERRSDGFHNIQSLLYPVKLSDILEVTLTEESQVSFHFTGLEIPFNGRPNLCQMAYFKILEKFPIPGVSIHLHKIIPIGSGLGGGSADAAFTLKLLNQLFSLKINTRSLKSMAAKLGSDCPFFIENRPSLVTGKGDQLETFPLDLSGLHILLVVPRIQISTAEAYAGIKPAQPEIPLKEGLGLPIKQWKGLIKNDFEPSIFRNHPQLAKIKEKLYRAGAIYASMSGSGSALYGIFEKLPPKTLRHSFSGMFSWIESF